MKKKSTFEIIEPTIEKLEETVNSRRMFIKKAAYAAPTLLVLGSLTRPTDAKAGFGAPPSGPTWPASPPGGF